MNKLFASAQAALDGVVKDGQTIAVGGFGATSYVLGLHALAVMQGK